MIAIKKPEIKKGALHAQLRVPMTEPILTKDLEKIMAHREGSKVVIGGKSHTVTKLLKKRAIFALNVR